MKVGHSLSRSLVLDLVCVVNEQDLKAQSWRERSQVRVSGSALCGQYGSVGVFGP